MPSIAEKAPLYRLAEILYAANLLGAGVCHAGDTCMNVSSENLAQHISELFRLLDARRIAYLLVGGVALLRYIEGRNTEDIDLVLSGAGLHAMPEIVVSKRDADFARGQYKDIRVAVLFWEHALFNLVYEKHATKHAFLEREVPCATVDGLILLKLYALPSLYRQGDTQRIALYETDITMLMDRYHTKMAPLLKIVCRYVDDGACKELKRIVADLEERIRQMHETRLSSPSDNQ
jgi:hypothetical protein